MKNSKIKITIAICSVVIFILIGFSMFPGLAKSWTFNEPFQVDGVKYYYHMIVIRRSGNDYSFIVVEQLLDSGFVTMGVRHNESEDPYAQRSFSIGIRGHEDVIVPPNTVTLVLESKVVYTKPYRELEISDDPSQFRSKKALKMLLEKMIRETDFSGLPNDETKSEEPEN